MKIRKAAFRLLGPILKWWTKHYFSKVRKYHYQGVKGVVLPGVFFPHLTWSTSILMDFLAKESLQDKSFLELGCGTGLISVLAAKKGAIVTASDINPKAIENALLNAKNNSIAIKTIQSDLFDNLSEQEFDFMVINPPYYPKNAENNEEKAWFCGEDFQYFQKLFSTIRPYLGVNSTGIMILSEDCDLEKIKEIAREKKIDLQQIEEVKKWAERNFIFRLECI